MKEPGSIDSISKPVSLPGPGKLPGANKYAGRDPIPMAMATWGIMRMKGI